MASASTLIYQTLMQRLVDANKNNLRLVPENSYFDPKTQFDPWIESAVIPSGSDSMGKEPRGSENKAGIFQVSVYWHQSIDGLPTGTGRIREELDVIAESFRRGDKLPNGLNIGAVVDSEIRFSGGFSIIDLSISYNAYITRV